MLNLNFNIIGSKSFEQERGIAYNPFPVQILLVGGGGGGGGCLTNDLASGGGAGGFISASWTMPALTTFDVVIGDGGIRGGVGVAPGTPTTGSNGGDTKLVLSSTSEVVFNAIGGGGGNKAGTSGVSGGSGGGNGVFNGETPTIASILPSDATLAFAATGSYGKNSNAPQTIMGDGGGAADGAGVLRSSTFIAPLAGLPTTFAAGGNGATTTDTTPWPAQVPNSGLGGNGGKTNISGTVQSTDGASGIFAIRYAGLPKATGGTITQSGGFTTHLFLSSSQLVVSGRNNSTP